MHVFFAGKRCNLPSLVSLLLPFGLLLAPPAARAQAVKGQIELSVSGDLFIPVKNTQGTTGLVALNGSKYFTRRVQVGIGTTENVFGDSQPVYNSNGVQVGTQTVLAVTSDPNVFARYNFSHGTNPFVPYLGVEGGTSIQSDGNTTQFQDNFYVRPHAGFKYYFSKRAAFDWNGGYQAVVKTPADGTVDFRIGISVLF